MVSFHLIVFTFLISIGYPASRPACNKYIIISLYEMIENFSMDVSF